MAAAELLEEIRKEAKPGIWTTGVTLARNGAVALQSRSGGEVELRVRAPGRTVPLTVVLYPDDAAWECDCPSRVDPCEHVCAAAIALQKVDTHDGPLATTAAKWTRVVYRFTRAEGGGLKLHRAIVEADGQERPLEPSLSALMSKPAEAAKLQVEQHDLIADRLLERPTRVALVPEKLDALLRVLQPARNVLLDGRAVAISDEVVLPRGVVEDRGPEIVVTLARDPRITELVSPGVAVCGDALCRLGEQDLTGPRLEKLPIVRAYPADQIAELTARILPELARRGLPLEVRSRRLPRIDRELKPHIALELTRIDAGLSVLPTLVYGSPPNVRIDNGRMVFLHGAVPLRDEPREQGLIQKLRDDLNLVPGRRATFTEAELLRFADKARRFGGAVTGDAAGLLSPNVTLRPDLELTSSQSDSGLPQVGFTLRFRVEGDEQGAFADASEVIRAWREGLGLVPIEGGGWAPLPRAWLDKHGERVAQLLAARADDGKVAAHALPELGALSEALKRPPPPGLDRLAPLVEGFDRLPEPTLPDDLTATLRPYQLQGVAWLAFLKSAGLGGILADDMGLGKTLQTICVLGPKTLVVCPTSVLPNWQAELARFRPSLKVNAYHGPGRALDPDADVTLTTYAILRLDQAALGATAWSTVVLDEAQAIKNPDSQAARAAFSLKADLRLALSGTPMENRLEELWSLMHFANPGLLGGRRDFEEKVARPASEGRPGVAESLRRRIRPFVLRRLKKDVAKDLPPRTESVRRVALDERERALYDAVFAATRAEVVKLLSDGGGGGVMKALEALLRLRQAACHPALVPGQHADTSSKVASLVDALTNAVDDGHKALVFSQWTSMLDLIEPALTAAGIPFERLDGSTPNRGEVTARFQSDGGAPVMLISLKAGGTGLNLTAADHVFLVDPWWNPAVEAQAADRAHRIGQERPVFVYRMISQGTIEERILGLQDKKRALFEAALGEASAAASITRDDLLELFA